MKQPENLPDTPKPWYKRHRRLCITAIILVIVAIGVVCFAKNFIAQEREIRTAWKIDTGEIVGTDDDLSLRILDADVASDLSVLYLEPEEIDTDGFTYYDTGVQDRIGQWLDNVKASDKSFTAQSPLAVLNPYGTGSNGLYLYFTTDVKTAVSYTIHVDDDAIPDYTATAYSGDSGYSTTHEFQMIGLVPGKTNEVTMTLTGSWGNVRQNVSFSITMPETASSYPTTLEYTDGDSATELSDGLFMQARTNGYLGYAFFFDNSGVMRYEMMLEGYGIDRVLEVDDDLLISTSASKLARVNRLGRVTATYDLGKYAMHHDMVLGEDGTVIALAEEADSDYLEDLVIQVNLDSGEVTELVDFKDLLADYLQNQARPVSATDGEFLYYGGKYDWIHLNTVQYLPENDSIIVSSRETSTIMKVENVHSNPTFKWFTGDARFWVDTAYADLCLEQVGDFIPQYGQHSVEYIGEGDTDGVYYLRMFNNNYFDLNHRDFEMDLDSSVGQSYYGGENQKSYVYIYKIDENAGTFELTESWPVPYSSIVSNVTHPTDSENYVVNSGMSNVFGEYDSDGNLIRQYAYTCTLQQYRTFKMTFSGFWFQ